MFRVVLKFIYKFLYMAPERLNNEQVLYRLKHTPLSYIVIDEAHCISHWGKDFRPSYLECKRLREWFPSLPIVALTATATDKVQADILELLQIPKATVIKGSLVRPSLAYMTYYIEDKWERLRRILTKNKDIQALFFSTFWIVVLMQPINAITFLFDGFYKGLGFTRVLRNAFVLATILGFFPAYYATEYFFHWGLSGIWIALFVWMCLRGGFLILHYKHCFYRKKILF